MPSKSETVPTSIRLTPVANDLWTAVGKELGLNKTAVLETLLREKAASLGLKPTVMAERLPKKDAEK